MPQPAVSKSEGAEPSSDPEEPSGSFVARHRESNVPAAETSGEVQGMLYGTRDDDCESAPDNANTVQLTPHETALNQGNAESVPQSAPSWRRLEARMEGVLPIWSIFKRFGRKSQHER